jgi:GNAT superfamily N-acetyltransferase
MSVEIRQMGTDALPRYSEVHISFLVESVFCLELKGSGLDGIELREEKVERPYIKDYDAAKGEGPTRWLKRFDMSNWGIFMAFRGERHIGGAIAAPGAYVGDLDTGFAQLFDIRLLPEERRHGSGSILLKYVADWAQQQGCKYLKIETQNTNVPACRFYAKQGAELGNIDKFAYAGYPESKHEVRLVWYLKL